MKTTAVRNAIHAQIARDIRWCSEAEARVARPAGDWRLDTLERAGELAQAGRLVESREMAHKAQQ